MKKGEIRKQEIMNAAETLFCQYGYEETSIQHILDLLKCSKGSFYHHYISKESLLTEICRKRAEQIHKSVVLKASAITDPCTGLNVLLSGMIPLQEEKLSFLMMFLHIFKLPEGKSIRNSYCDALSECFHDNVTELIASAMNSGVIPRADSAALCDIAFCLVNRLWVKICELIISAEQCGKEADITELLELTNEYRKSMERILFLPYGSLELVSIPVLKTISEQIHNHWNP